jgi:hypothetical protein
MENCPLKSPHREKEKVQNLYDIYNKQTPLEQGEMQLICKAEALQLHLALRKCSNDALEVKYEVIGLYINYTPA